MESERMSRMNEPAAAAGQKMTFFTSLICYLNAGNIMEKKSL